MFPQSMFPQSTFPHSMFPHSMFPHSMFCHFTAVNAAVFCIGMLMKYTADLFLFIFRNKLCIKARNKPVLTSRRNKVRI